jgi:hypothetical protein
LTEVHRLRVFEIRVLRKTFGTYSSVVTGEWRRLYNEEMCDVYSSPNIIWVINSKKMRRVGACCTYRGENSYMQRFSGKP